MPRSIGKLSGRYSQAARQQVAPPRLPHTTPSRSAGRFSGGSRCMRAWAACQMMQGRAGQGSRLAGCLGPVQWPAPFTAGSRTSSSKIADMHRAGELALKRAAALHAPSKETLSAGTTVEHLQGGCFVAEEGVHDRQVDAECLPTSTIAAATSSADPAPNSARTASRTCANSLPPPRPAKNLASAECAERGAAQQHISQRSYVAQPPAREWQERPQP